MECNSMMISKNDIVSAMKNLSVKTNPKYEGTAFVFKAVRAVVLNGNTF